MAMNKTAPTSLPADFSERGQSAWMDYQANHNLESLRGQVAAVDPQSGRVWIGGDSLEAVDKMHADGVDTPVWLVRVGYDHLYVKDRR